MGHAVHELHDAGGFERREGEQEEETGDEHRPHEEGHAHPGEAAGTEVDDGGDEVHRAEQRGSDQQDQADEPLGLAGQPLVDDLAIGESGEWRVVGPTGFRGAGLHEERGAHHEATGEVDPVAHHVEAGERHVGGTDLERGDVVAEGAEAEGHDAEEHHDRAVHRAEHVVGVASDLTILEPACFPGVGEDPAHPFGQWLVRVGDAPAHHHHQVETEGEEQQGGDAVLDADHLVVGGEHIFREESRIVMMIVVMVGGVSAHGTWGGGSSREIKGCVRGLRAGRRVRSQVLG